MRHWKLLVLIVVGAPIAYYGFGLFILFFGIWSPAGSEYVGTFTLSYERADFMGHKSHRTTLYYRQRWRDLLVSRSLLYHSLDPRNPDRMIYSNSCYKDADEAYCGVVYVDGARRRKWKIAPVGRNFSPSTVQWTPDGSYAMVVLNIDQEVVFIDLERGTVTSAWITQASATPPWRAIRFESWSPDFRAAAVLVSNQWRPGPDASYDYDLHWVDLAAATVTYVRTLSAAERRDGAVEWAADGSTYRPASDKGTYLPERTLPRER